MYYLRVVNSNFYLITFFAIYLRWDKLKISLLTTQNLFIQKKSSLYYKLVYQCPCLLITMLLFQCFPNSTCTCLVSARRSLVVRQNNIKGRALRFLETLLFFNLFSKLVYSLTTFNTLPSNLPVLLSKLPTFHPLIPNALSFNSMLYNLSCMSLQIHTKLVKIKLFFLRSFNVMLF